MHIAAKEFTRTFTVAPSCTSEPLRTEQQLEKQNSNLQCIIGQCGTLVSCKRNENTTHALTNALIRNLVVRICLSDPRMWIEAHATEESKKHEVDFASLTGAEGEILS